MPHSKAALLLLAYLTLISNSLQMGKLFKRMLINSYYGSFALTSYSNVSTLIECGARCQDTSSIYCNGFRYDGGLCDLVHIWSLDNALRADFNKGDLRTTYVSMHHPTEWCPKISVLASTFYDKPDCAMSRIPGCETNDHHARWVLDGKHLSCDVLDQNVWLGKQWAGDQYILFDLGCLRQIREFELMNNFCLVDGKTSWLVFQRKKPEFFLEIFHLFQWHKGIQNLCQSRLEPC